MKKIKLTKQYAPHASRLQDDPFWQEFLSEEEYKKWQQETTKQKNNTVNNIYSQTEPQEAQQKNVTEIQQQLMQGFWGDGNTQQPLAAQNSSKQNDIRQQMQSVVIGGRDALGKDISSPISSRKPMTQDIMQAGAASVAAAPQQASQSRLISENQNFGYAEQENYSSAANNKNNSVGNDTGKKTVRGEGLHYLPNGGTDSYGRKLPAGSYIRVANGQEYIVLPNDPRINERIKEEYQRQEAASQAEATEQKKPPQDEAADNSQLPLNPEDDKDWEGAFSGPDTEDEEIEYPARLLDDIASDIYVSGFLWDNGLTPRYKVGADGNKVVEIKLKNGETAILKEDKDFCYGYDGTPYFTKDFVEKNGHLALIEDKTKADTDTEAIVNEAGNIYGIDYDIAEDGYGMIIDDADEDISKWQDPSWMTSEKQYDPLDEKYGEIYSQWKVSQGFNDTRTNKKGHLGIDMVPQDPNNTGIYPIFPGEVVFMQAENLSANGVCIVVKHSINGIIFYSAYGHMENGSIPLTGENAIKVGSIVNEETRIGTMGGTAGLDKNGNQLFIDEHLHLSVFTAPEAYANRGFYGYYVKNRNESFDLDAYYTATNQDKNRIYYDPLKVMQSNGQIIYYNDSANDNSLKT